MELTSLNYLLFMAAFLVLYFIAALIQGGRWQKWLILAASVFYILMTTGALSLVVILAVCGLVLSCGRQIEKYRKTDKKRAWRYYMTGAILDIGILLYFKFFTGTFDALAAYLQGSRGISLPDLVTPIGLSYYALSLYGYLYDIYHKKIKAETNFFNLLTYMTYFPALIQGPFNLYKDLMPKLQEVHPFDEARVVSGLQRILWGYFQETVIADRIGILVMGILRDDASSGLMLFWCMTLFSFQIYADFAGGIDIIMGLSEAMGIDLPENFRAPLVSQTVTDYWQRWHMTLGTVMEKYVYFPLVFSKRLMKLSRKIRHKYLSRVFTATAASVIVFILVGIWHGTGWNYVVYGLYQAFWVSQLVLLKPVYENLKTRFHVDETCLSWKIFRSVRTFVILVFGRFLIKASDLPQAMHLLARTVKGDHSPAFLFDGDLLNYGLDYKNLYLMYLMIVLLIVIDILHEKGIHFRALLMRQDIVFRYAVYMAMLFAIIIFGVYGPEYSETAFIYAGF